MKILFLSQLFPLPLDSGGKIKSYYTLKALAREHEVHLLTYIRTDEERSHIRDLDGVCAGVHVVPLRRSKLRQVSDLAVSLARRRSFIVSRDDRREMHAAFRELVAECRPDVVHIDHLQAAQFVDFDADYRTVLDHHNIESLIIKRMAETARSLAVRVYSSVEWPKLQRYELDICRRCDVVLTVSENDAETLRALDPSLGCVHSVPIGVDVDFFRPVERVSGSRNILSIGTMYWPPNVDSMLYFCNDILPLVRKVLQGCTVTIAGQRPTAAIRALGSDSDVTVLGYVDDVRDVARDCGVFIVPLRSGSGVRVKILSALAMGLPVVSTSVGVEGIEAMDGEHLLVADTPQEFASAIAKVVTNSDLANRLGQGGRELVCRQHSWDVIGQRLLDIYRREFREISPGS